jgi:hypothetical protein
VIDAVAWSPSGLNEGAAAALRKLPGVRAVSMVASGLLWLRSSHDAGGRVVDRSAPGYAIPVEAEAVAPNSYARFVPTAERPDIRSLRPGQTIMARTEAGLRGGGAGLRLGLATGPVRVTRVVSDQATEGYEIVIPRPAPSTWTPLRTVALIRMEPAARALVRAHLQALLPRDRSDSSPVLAG